MLKITSLAKIAHTVTHIASFAAIRLDKDQTYSGECGGNMAKKLLALGEDGRIVLKLPGGKIESLPEQQRAHAYLLIDCSGSMAGSNIVQAKEGVLAFALDAVRKNYSVGLIRFSDSAEVLSSLKDGISGLKSRLHMLEASGETNMTDALNLAKSELASLSGIRVIVIATDGAPNLKESCLEAAKSAKAEGIDIITIGTDDADCDFLALLATRPDLAVIVASSHLMIGISEAVKLLPASTGSKGKSIRACSH